MSFKSIIIFTSILGYLIFSYCVYWVFDNEIIDFLTREDGFFETLGALSFLISSIIFFYLFLKLDEENRLFGFELRKNIFFLLLGIAFFIAFGEEISWGKRIFEFQTIGYIGKLNMKQGMVVHSLTYHIKEELTKLFLLLWLPYCLILPLISMYSRKVYKFIIEIDLPLPPIWVGLLFLLNYILDMIFSNLSVFLSDQNHSEIDESNFAVLFLVLAIYFLFQISNTICPNYRYKN